MNNLVLLILDERASPKDMVRVYKLLNGYQISVQERDGTTILANDSAIEGNEDFFEKEAGIKFFPNWKKNKGYREMIERGLLDGEKYMMYEDLGEWKFKEASVNSYEIIKGEDGLDLRLKR